MIGKRSKPPKQENTTKKAKRRTAKPRRGTLVLIAGLLVGSAILRLGIDAGQVLARQADMTKEDSKHAARPEPESCAPPPDVAAMLTAFQDRERQIKDREAQLRSRMQALSVVDKEIAAKMAALTKAEARLICNAISHANPPCSVSRVATR